MHHIIAMMQYYSMNINGKQVKLGWIAGMPRSGTTWVSQIFASCPDVRMKFCPLFSYEFKNSLDKNSSQKEWEKLFADVYQTQSEFLDQEHLRKKGLVPAFKKKIAKPGYLLIKSNRFHNLVPYILKLNTEIRFVHIVRHPCASLYSWLSTPSEFPKNADPKEEWRSGLCRKTGPGEFWGFEDWLFVTRLAVQLTKEYPNRHLVMRYEDIVKNPLTQTKKMFNFFRLPLHKQTIDFIKLSHSRHDNRKHSVFKFPQIHNQWNEKLDPAIISACTDEIVGTELERFLTD